MRETAVHASPYSVPREERGLTRVAFTRLLEWLDNGVDSQGESYLEMRRRLVFYFDRRNRMSADELADETFDRIGRTLEKDGAIAVTPPARYCYVVARFVLLEDIRRDHTHVRLDETRSIHAPAGEGATLFELDGSRAIREPRLDCLDGCLARLKAEQRELVLEYYGNAGQQKIGRRDLAKRLGISLNALGIRACRIRRALETCLQTGGKG
jgi:DNA-directed RNA polymerase specialized sigma24 family protein